MSVRWVQVLLVSLCDTPIQAQQTSVIRVYAAACIAWYCNVVFTTQATCCCSCRYMILLRLGGVYADIDVECRQPLDSVIQPADTLLVGWDDEVGDPTAAAQRHLARQRQVASWFFAAAPGHPVLRQVCDHIARNAMTVFSNNTVRDSLERTGQGVFTDMVLKWALQHPPAKHDDPWKVRILPRVAFGVRASEANDELRPDLPGVVVLHHFQNSWQGNWPAHRKALQNLFSWRRSGSSLLEPLEHVQSSNVTHYPVSVDFYPPFTMMTDLVGTGDRQAAADVSAAITAHGTWQPAVAPFRRPAVVEALVGALSRHSSSMANSPAAAAATAPAAPGSAAPSSSKSTSGSTSTAGQAAAALGSISSSRSRRVHQGVLVDIGAGHGFFSLAAAARGHRVVAFETSAGSLSAFKASIAYNGFGGLIDVQEAVLGAQAGTACLQQRKTQAAAAALSSGKQQSNHSNLAMLNAPGSSSSASSDNPIASAQQPQHSHGTADTAVVGSQDADCAHTVPQLRLSDVLANNTAVAVLRISAHGQEGWILEGALDYLTNDTKPQVIYVEFWPAEMVAAGYSKPTRLIQQLYELGYTDVAHAGRVCDHRWQNVTQVMRSQVRAAWDLVRQATLICVSLALLASHQQHKACFATTVNVVHALMPLALSVSAAAVPLGSLCNPLASRHPAIAQCLCPAMPASVVHRSFGCKIRLLLLFTLCRGHSQ
eukprot:GHUV01019462.1.p1 GENE.GHUV01019462.1~~GHUV01019462.1.p1  ORF type:complete len:712 (+),score=229.78 GHUV01019462.1:1971-4106(+)